MGERMRARARVSVRTAAMQVSLGSAERGGGVVLVYMVYMEISDRL
jgi:hypothetical protein